MLENLYCRALFILHKNAKPTHFHDVIEKEVFDSHTKENHFFGLENAKLLHHCSFDIENRKFWFCPISLNETLKI